MIITIDTTKDTLDVQDIYSDSDMEMLAKIKKARFNEIDIPESPDIATIKKVVAYLKKIPNGLYDSPCGDSATIQQIKLVRAVTNMALKEAKDLVQSV